MAEIFKMNTTNVPTGSKRKLGGCLCLFCSNGTGNTNINSNEGISGCLGDTKHYLTKLSKVKDEHEEESNTRYEENSFEWNTNDGERAATTVAEKDCVADFTTTNPAVRSNVEIKRECDNNTESNESKNWNNTENRQILENVIVKSEHEITIVKHEVAIVKSEHEITIVKHEVVISDDEDQVQTNVKDEVVISDSEDEVPTNFKSEVESDSEDEEQTNPKYEIVISDSEDDTQISVKCEDVTLVGESKDELPLHSNSKLLTVKDEMKPTIKYVLISDSDDESIQDETESNHSSSDIKDCKDTKATNLNKTECKLEDCTAEDKSSTEIAENEAVPPQLRHATVKTEWNLRTIYIGNLPTTIQEKQLWKFLERYGKIENVTILSKSCGQPVPAAYSFIRFEKCDDALKALEINGMKYENHSLRVQMLKDSSKRDPNKSIFIRYTGLDIEEAYLQDVFQSCGPVVSTDLVRDEHTRTTGIGFVNFASVDSVERALKIKHIKIGDECKVRITKYKVGKGKKHHTDNQNLEAKNSKNMKRKHKQHKRLTNETLSQRDRHPKIKVRRTDYNSVNITFD